MNPSKSIKLFFLFSDACSYFLNSVTHTELCSSILPVLCFSCLIGFVTLSTIIDSSLSELSSVVRVQVPPASSVVIDSSALPIAVPISVIAADPTVVPAAVTTATDTEVVSSFWTFVYFQFFLVILFIVCYPPARMKLSHCFQKVRPLLCGIVVTAHTLTEWYFWMNA
jgi:hypothetical protein